MPLDLEADPLAQLDVDRRQHGWSLFEKLDLDAPMTERVDHLQSDVPGPHDGRAVDVFEAVMQLEAVPHRVEEVTAGKIDPTSWGLDRYGSGADHQAVVGQLERPGRPLAAHRLPMGIDAEHTMVEQ